MLARPTVYAAALWLVCRSSIRRASLFCVRPAESALLLYMHAYMWILWQSTMRACDTFYAAGLRGNHTYTQAQTQAFESYVERVIAQLSR